MSVRYSDPVLGDVADIDCEATTKGGTQCKRAAIFHRVKDDKNVCNTHKWFVFPDPYEIDYPTVHALLTTAMPKEGDYESCDGLADAWKWECESCREDVGWCKHEGFEKVDGKVNVTFECGHCGSTWCYDLATGDPIYGHGHF